MAQQTKLPHRLAAYVFLCASALQIGAAAAQTGRMKIVEIYDPSVAVQVTDGGTVTPARSNMTVSPQALICPLEAGKKKGTVLLAPEDENMGKARLVSLGWGTQCVPAIKAWERAEGTSYQRFMAGVVRLFKREGGETIRASASTSGGTRGSNGTTSGPRGNEQGNVCLAEQTKPLGKNGYVYVPEGKHTLVFFANIKDGQNVDILDGTGKVLATAKTKDRQLLLPAINYTGKSEFTLRGSNDAQCDITIDVRQPIEGLRFEDALAAAPNADIARALYADEIMLDPKREGTADPAELHAAWYAYALSLISPPQPSAVTHGPESSASWKKWSAYWGSQTMQPVVQK